MSDKDEKDDPSSWGSLGGFIKAQRELANLSMRRLAEISKISNPYLSQIERGMYKPSADVLKNIASALRVSAETMYAQAGLLEERPPGEGPAALGVEEAIRVDERLSVEQKDTLIRIYRGFTISG